MALDTFSTSQARSDDTSSESQMGHLKAPCLYQVPLQELQTTILHCPRVQKMKVVRNFSSRKKHLGLKSYHNCKALLLCHTYADILSKSGCHLCTHLIRCWIYPALASKTTWWNCCLVCKGELTQSSKLCWSVKEQPFLKHPFLFQGW